LGSLIYVGVCALIHILDPFIDGSAYLKMKHEMLQEKEEERKGRYGLAVFFGILILIPLLIIVLRLLSSADPVFGSMLERLYINMYVPEYIFGIAGLTLFAFFAAYGCFASVMENTVSGKDTCLKKGEPVMAITFSSVLAAVYFVFSLIQIIYLFGGRGALPAGYSYAQYARQGFFQLLFVCILNLGLVLVCLTCFGESKLLKIILTIISGCTFIMIASSAYRMLLYIDVYKLTFIRVLVLWSLLLLAVLLAGILVSIYHMRFPLFKYCMLAVTLLYLGLSFSHQDYWIAKYNISAAGKENTQGDWNYISCLSKDAIPALAEYEKSGKAAVSAEENYFLCYYESVRDDLITEGERMTFRTFNLSKWMAWKTAAASRD
ncbi:MAG TPA: DUF4173 domain-containing protein, partial [Lachnospiraceae bacterium]|nr:DUF4173 domain-containing protein [Lachnospiraceae bacterium]